MKNKKGYFGVGIYHCKHEVNVGTLWRSAYQLGSDYIYTIGRRYKTQASDTVGTHNHIPLFHYSDYEDFILHLPQNTSLVCVEMGGTPLCEFDHPKQAVYLLGAEDSGLPNTIIKKARRVVSIPSLRINSYNVSVAGSIVLYDRMVKQQQAGLIKAS